VRKAILKEYPGNSLASVRPIQVALQGSRESHIETGAINAREAFGGQIEHRRLKETQKREDPKNGFITRFKAIHVRKGKWSLVKISV
jgi:hypothetical protein